MSLEIKVKGIKDFEAFVAKAPEIAERAAAMAINTNARKVYADTKRKIMSQVNLKAGYLDGRDGTEPRLKITKKAKPGDLSSGIRGRQRATSLARFDAKQLYAPAKRGGKKKAGVSVMVKNRRVKMSRAFLVNLKNGNQGLAMRLKEGERIKNKNIMGQRMGGSNSRDSDVYLLYGPSVEQVFRTERGGKSIIGEGVEYVETHLDKEFRRQFERLMGGG